jgi:hypothetical protein
VKLEDLDRIVTERRSDVVSLNALPTVFLAEDGVTFEPTDHVIPQPDDDTYLHLLGLRYPGIVFDLPPEVPLFHDPRFDVGEWQKQRDLKERCDEPIIVRGQFGSCR